MECDDSWSLKASARFLLLFFFFYFLKREVTFHWPMQVTWPHKLHGDREINSSLGLKEEMVTLSNDHPNYALKNYLHSRVEKLGFYLVSFPKLHS